MVNVNGRRISAGSYDLNKWLYGGYEKGIVTMIAGPPGSGKTNFGILAGCSWAKRGKVLFIDSEGGFSTERVKQIVGEEYEKILSNILLLQITNFDEQKKTFEKLASQVEKSRIGLIVVDSMAMLYRLELGDASYEKDEARIRNVNADLAAQMKLLAEISRTKNIPVIITNQVYSSFLSDEDLRAGVKRETNIVGGDLMKYWSKCIIELKNEGGKRKAVLLKHRSLPEKEFAFDIRNKGIFRRGWI